MGKLGISKVSHGITNLIPEAAERERGGKRGRGREVRFVSLERDYADYTAGSSSTREGGRSENLKCRGAKFGEMTAWFLRLQEIPGHLSGRIVE